MRFFLKSIDCWSIVETGWTKPVNATLKLVTEKNVRLSDDKALHANFGRLMRNERFKKKFSKKNEEGPQRS
jgi:hypothetical protein